MKLSTRILFVITFSLTCNYAFSQKFEPVKEIPPGKALIYIYRPGSMVGALVHYTVNANDEKVSEAHLRNNTYLVFFADPGSHTLWREVSGARSKVILNVEAGKTYYVRGSCCDLIIPLETKAKEDIIKCKLSTLP
jgi:hypothetical protein